jgi:metallo-beta-lactamase family protein
VRIFGIDVPVEAEVVDVGAFSSHADAGELVAFARSCQRTVEHVFLVHGEEPQAQSLAAKLRGAGIGPVTVPQAGAFHDFQPEDVADKRASA